MNFLQNLKIGTKITLLVSMISVFMLMIIAIGLKQISASGKEIKNIISNTIPLLEEIEFVSRYEIEMLLHTERAVKWGKRVRNAESYQNFKTETKKVRVLSQSINKVLQKGEGLLEKNLESEMLHPSDRDGLFEIDFQLRNLHKDHARYEYLAERVFNLLFQKKFNEADKTLKKTYQQGLVIQGDIQQLVASIKKFNVSIAERVESQEKRTMFVMVVSSLVILLLSILLGVFIIKSIKAPLAYAVEVVEKVGQGQEVFIETKAKDETGVFLNAVKKMSEDLRESSERERAKSKELETAYLDLKSTQNQLTEVQKLESIGQLAGGVAHDFNNILGSILGYSSLLKTQFKDDKKVYKRLSVMEDAAQRGAKLTQSLLGFSRKGNYEMVKMNINHVIKEALNLLDRSIGKAITVEQNLDSDVWIVEGDSTQMMQIFMNLGINAQHAMPDGGKLTFKSQNIKIDREIVEDSKVLQPGHYVLITVSDTGTGIPKDIQDKIFEPFFTTKEVGKGTGLGLSMAFGIIKSHGGAISVYSEKGQGTTFRIYIPACVDQAQIARSEAEESHLQSIKINKNVLVVDDEESMRKVAEDILKTHGATVRVVSNGQEAIEAYQDYQNEIDFVLLDIVMPQLDGIKTYSIFKDINPDVKIIFVSGHVASQEIQEIRKSKNVEFIQKPYKRSTLIEAVLKTIG